MDGQQALSIRRRGAVALLAARPGRRRRSAFCGRRALLRRALRRPLAALRRRAFASRFGLGCRRAGDIEIGAVDDATDTRKVDGIVCGTDRLARRRTAAAAKL
jgi:hypothetical protein